MIKTKSLTKTGLALVALTALAGCASGQITADDCGDNDAYEIGLEDGQDGKHARLPELRNACSASDLTRLEERYEYGRRVGLVEFCDDEQAKKDARAGSPNPVCREVPVPPYQAAYNKELQDSQEDMRKEMAKLEEEKAEILKRQEELKARLATPASDTATW